jgi:hypothetical protein
MMGEMKLETKNKVNIFRMRSSSSGANKLNKNIENGMRVVLKKKERQFFINFIVIWPVSVYLLSHSVNMCISLSSIKFVTYIPTEKITESTTSA